MNIFQKHQILKSHKKKGYILIQSVLALIMLGAISVSLFQIYGGQFSALAASRTGTQAQQVAELIAEHIKMQDLASLGINEDDPDSTVASDRKKVSDIFENALNNTDLADWEVKWEIGKKKTYTTESGDDTGDLRIAEISVYKPGEIGARNTLHVPLSSAGSSGMFYPDYNNLIYIPYNINYIVPKDGYVNLSGTTRNEHRGYLFINGQLINYGHFEGSGDYGLCIVKKDDVVQWYTEYLSSGGEGFTCKYYPRR